MHRREQATGVSIGSVDSAFTETSVEGCGQEEDGRGIGEAPGARPRETREEEGWGCDSKAPAHRIAGHSGRYCHVPQLSCEMGGFTLLLSFLRSDLGQGVVFFFMPPPSLWRPRAPSFWSGQGLQVS